MYVDRRVYYGVEAMLAIAGAPGGRAVSAVELALDLGAPSAWVEALLERLRAASLLTGGAQDSGYRLAREARAMSLVEIAEAVDPDRPDRRTLAQPTDRVLQSLTGGAMLWSALETAIILCLKDVTLDDLLSEEARFDETAWDAFKRAGGVPSWRG